MPISPYTGSVLYTGFTSGRPYTGAGTTSKVSRSDIGLPYKLSSSNSSSAVKSSPFGSAPFLTGNTAALKKTFSDAFVPGVSRNKEKTSPSGSYGHSGNYNVAATDNKYTCIRNTTLDDIKEVSNRPNKYEGGLYVNRYSNFLMAKSNAEREKSLRPKEIDASRINVTGKPPRPSVNYNDVKRLNDNESSISRNRQVVRLTIKREKEKAALLPIYDSSVKTIAQKLLEKYTVHEKKKEEPIVNVPRNRWLTASDSPKGETPIVDKPPKSPERSQTTANIKTTAGPPSKCSTVGKSKSCYTVDDGHDGDDELSSDDDESSSDESSSEETSSWLVRANRAASMTRELQNKQDVKDAIVAAVLNPAVDIESDEEMKQLVEDEEYPNERSLQDNNENTLTAKPDLLDTRKKLEPEIGGEILVDRLKRFVKQQVSNKKESLKKPNKISPKKEMKENIINKTKERIIPIIIQDDYHTTNKRKSDTKEGIKSKTCKIIPICLEDRQNHESFPSKLDKMQILNDNNNDNDSNEAAKSLPKVSLLLTERETTIKCLKKSLAKSSSPVYQTTLGEPLEALPVSFQTSSLVSGEHSITQPENKVPGTSSFISDLVSDSKEQGKEFLSLSSSAGKGVKIKPEAKPTSLANFKTTTEIVNERKDAEKRNNKIPSELDNSISETSSKLKRGEGRRISDRIDDCKSNYILSDEIDGKEESDESEEEEIDKTRIKKKEIYSKKSPQRLPEENVEASRREPKTESSYADWNESHVSNPITHFDLDAKKECPLSSPKEANYVNSSPTNNLIPSAGLFQKSSRENSLNESNSLQEKSEKQKTNAIKNDIKPLDKNMTSISKKYDLQKSATTQIATGSQNVELKTNVCHDAESISYNDDADIKPSLRQFLEDSRTDMKNYKEIESNQKTSVATKPISELGKISESSIQEENQETAKKAIKRPRQVNHVVAENVEAKLAPNVSELTINRVILKRPVKVIQEQKPGTTRPLEEIKPKKVWKKPVPPFEAAKPTNEYLKILNQLKTVKVKNDVDKSKSKDDIIKTVKEVKLKKRSSKENPEAKSDDPNITSEQTKSGEGEISIELQSVKEKISDVFDKKSWNETEPNKSSDAKPLIKRSKKKSSNTENSENVIENISSDTKTYSGKVTERFSEKDSEKELDKNLSKSALSTSHSADSAYGSSPSTPQPRPVEKPEDRGPEEEERKSTEGDKSNKQENIDENYKCEMCGTNCHKKCEKQMPNLCGVNQKLLAEALSSVKKGSSTDGRDVYRTLNAAATSKSVSSVSSTEGDTTTTDDDETDTDCSEYSGPAEIRPPITTRPKYKKYTIEDFNFIKVLGKGSFGKVMLAQQICTENYFAVKCLKKDVVLEDNDVECCLIERKVLTLGTKHPYLCHLFCSFQTPSHLFFVMEYLTGGDLMFHIQHVGRFDEYRACFYAAEITSGLKFLHSKGIIYRDLKLDNILLDYEGHIRIADFGMCKLQIYLDKFADTFCGTPDYMAPEVIKGAHYNQCVDWWSFGVLMYEMMTGKSPFKGCDEDHLFWLICNEEPFYPRFLSREAQSILKQLLDKDSNRRLGPPYSPYGEIKDHQFFKYVDWNKIERKEVETPYKPRLRHILDVQYFDRLFTKRNATLTPLDDSILETMDQTPFKDFSYTNPNITD